MEVKRTKTPEQALRALMNVCAKSERAISDVRRSLTRWGVAPEQHQPIIDRLVRERFIDEARYAEAYVREKLNLSRWGVRKIRAALKAKRIPEQTIDAAGLEIYPGFVDAHSHIGLDGYGEPGVDINERNDICCPQLRAIAEKRKRERT